MSSLHLNNGIVIQRWEDVTAEAGRIDPEGEKWIFWLKDWTDKGQYCRAGEYSSYEEACEKVFDNFVLSIFHGKWTQHVANQKEDYGFLAMQYSKDEKREKYDVELEELARDLLKPVVRETLGYELIDMRDDLKAGIMDVTLRNLIKNSKFVIADLTHDNNGVYWEAGYADALEKPVLYICEKEKFKKLKTHFDTNHCTTVLWSIDSRDKFKDEFSRALQRSLNVKDI